jgi:hypothetical protein
VEGPTTPRTTGIAVPAEVVYGLGRGKWAPLRITINPLMHRSFVASVGGEFIVGVSELREDLSEG